MFSYKREPAVPSAEPIAHEVTGNGYEETERDKVALSPKEMKPKPRGDGKTTSSEVVREQAGTIWLRKLNCR